MSLRLSKYIKDLRKEAHRFECTDINNKVSKSFWGQNQRRIICITSSLIIFLFLKEGFNPDFVAYASTAISILIGLFTTTIIFILDKYKPVNRQDTNTLLLLRIINTLNRSEEEEKLPPANSREKLWETQAYNYTKQFAFITGYNIVLCVFTLVLLSFSSLFVDTFNINVWSYEFCWDIINYKTIVTALIVLLVIIQRFFVLYWLASIAYNTLYAVSSMVKYMIVKMDR